MIRNFLRGSFARACAKLLLPFALLGGLTACAQRFDQVDVGIGTGAFKQQAAAPYAARYLPYARMASLSYLPEAMLTPKVDRGGARNGLCPSPAALATAAPNDKDAKEALEMLQTLTPSWACQFGRIGIENCPKGMICKGGLEYQVWRRGCSEAVIAFRGTDGLRDIGDWISNLRWFVGNQYYDQYDQTHDEIPAVVRSLRAACPKIAITAVGHSLGGGLAQSAGHANPQVSYVYAFDPSPVTAYFDVSEKTLAKSAVSHGVDRVYQAGEVLSVPRALASGVFPPSSCRPPVRVVRFASRLRFDVFERHKLAGLIDDMKESAKGYKGKPARLMDPHRCTITTAAMRP